MITTTTAYRIVDNLWQLKARRWEKHCHRRIYIETEELFALANISAPTHRYGTLRFYLDLDTAKWKLTGNKDVDQELIAYLNAAAACAEINEAYAGKSRQSRDEKYQAVEAVEAMSDAEILAKDDSELIALIEASRLSHGRNMWAARIAMVQGISTPVILTVIKSLNNWFEDEWNLRRQPHFPAGYFEKVMSEAGFRDGVTDYIAKFGGADDADLLTFIARNTTIYRVLRDVGNNRNTPLPALLHIKDEVESRTLVNHPEVTDEVLAELALQKPYAELIAKTERKLTQATVDAISGHNDITIVQSLILNHPYAYTPEQTLRVSHWFTGAQLVSMIGNPMVPGEVIVGLIQEKRQAVRNAARLELEKRGYTETWVAPSN
jgi:hypothetical protein